MKKTIQKLKVKSTSCTPPPTPGHQAGTQQVTERRVRLGGTDLSTLEELGY